ncbi:MAG: GGDEF domain-containing protein [Verrucomicrobia bacterium]|nr:GGDEF domain-containing protein [Verrucomicrobiota bacterium]
MSAPSNKPAPWKARLAEAEKRLREVAGQLAETTRALKESEKHLRRVARLDALTGLFNRRGLEHELRCAWALAGRQRSSVGLLIVDLDHFKRINDVHGHPAGDQVLRECAHLLKADLRVSDVICRYGGDEMVAVLPFANSKETRAVAGRILQRIRRHIFGRGRYNLHVTLSIGLACARPAPRSSPDTLLARADRALYRAKRAGRDCARS